MSKRFHFISKIDSKFNEYCETIGIPKDSLPRIIRAGDDANIIALTNQILKQKPTIAKADIQEIEEHPVIVNIKEKSDELIEKKFSSEMQRQVAKSSDVLFLTPEALDQYVANNRFKFIELKEDKLKHFFGTRHTGTLSAQEFIEKVKSSGIDSLVRGDIDGLGMNADEKAAFIAELQKISDKVIADEKVASPSLVGKYIDNPGVNDKKYKNPTTNLIEDNPSYIYPLTGVAVRNIVYDRLRIEVVYKDGDRERFATLSQVPNPPTKEIENIFYTSFNKDVRESEQIISRNADSFVTSKGMMRSSNSRKFNMSFIMDSSEAIVDSRLNQLKTNIASMNPKVDKVKLFIPIKPVVKDKAGKDVQLKAEILEVEVSETTQLADVMKLIKDKEKEMIDAFNGKTKAPTPPANPPADKAQKPNVSRVAGKKYKMQYVDLEFEYLLKLISLAKNNGLLMELNTTPEAGKKKSEYDKVTEAIEKACNEDKEVRSSSVQVAIKILQTAMLSRWKTDPVKGKELNDAFWGFQELKTKLSREDYSQDEEPVDVPKPKNDLYLHYSKVQEADKKIIEAARSKIMDPNTSKRAVKNEGQKRYQALVGDGRDLGERLRIMVEYQRHLNRLDSLKVAVNMAKQKRDAQLSGQVLAGDGARELQQANNLFYSAYREFAVFCETKSSDGRCYRDVAVETIGNMQAVNLSYKMTGEPKEAYQHLFNISQAPLESLVAYQGYIGTNNELEQAKEELEQLKIRKAYCKSRGKTYELKEVLAEIKKCENKIVRLQKKLAKEVHLTDKTQSTDESVVRGYEQSVLRSVVGRTGLFDAVGPRKDRMMDWVKGNIGFREIGTEPSIDIETIRLYRQAVSNTGVDRDTVEQIVEQRKQIERDAKVK